MKPQVRRSSWCSQGQAGNFRLCSGFRATFQSLHILYNPTRSCRSSKDLWQFVNTHGSKPAKLVTKRGTQRTQRAASMQTCRQSVSQPASQPVSQSVSHTPCGAWTGKSWLTVRRQTNGFCTSLAMSWWPPKCSKALFLISVTHSRLGLPTLLTKALVAG